MSFINQRGEQKVRPSGGEGRRGPRLFSGIAATLRRDVKLHSLSRRLLAVGAAAVLAACNRGGAAAGRTRIQAPPAPVPTAIAHRTSVEPTLTIAGIIAPLQNVAISTSLSEPTLAVYVNEGERVRRGQLLALLDSTDLRANLAAQEALARSDDARVAQTQYQADLTYQQNPDQVTQARAALRSAQETLAQGRQDLARDRALVTNGYIASQQYDQQTTTTRTETTNVRSAEAALASAIANQNVNGTPARGLQAANVASTVAEAASARAQIEQIRSQIARASIVSPVDGVVVNRNLNPGEYPGSRTSFTVQEISSVYAELNASSADVFRIRSGSPVSLIAGADATGRVYHGTVVAVLGQVQPGSTNFTVKALVQNADSTLQSGIPVTATISLGRSQGVGIPTTAFLDDTNSSVLAIRRGTALTQSVRQVATSGTTSIVSGLAAGTPVVANGQLGIVSGQKLDGSRGGGGRRRHASPAP